MGRIIDNQGHPAFQKRHYDALPEHAKIVLHDQLRVPAWVFGAHLPYDKGSSNARETETCGEIVQSEHQNSSHKMQKKPNTKRQLASVQHPCAWTSGRTGATFARSPLLAEPPLKKTRVSWSQGHLLPGVCLDSVSNWKNG